MTYSKFHTRARQGVFCGFGIEHAKTHSVHRVGLGQVPHDLPIACLLVGFCGSKCRNYGSTSLLRIVAGRFLSCVPPSEPFTRILPPTPRKEWHRLYRGGL